MDVDLQTASLALRHFVVEDAATVLALSEEPNYRQWLPSQTYADEAAARAVLEFLIRQCTSPGDPRRGPYVLAIDHRPDRRLIGHVGFSPIDDEVEIGFSIAEAYQGRGFAVEAIAAACCWAFERFHLTRIVAIAAQSNVASRRTLERVGFAHEHDRVMRFQGREQAVSVYFLVSQAWSRQATG